MLEKYFQELYKELQEDLAYSKSSWDATDKDEIEAEAKLELLNIIYRDVFGKDIYTNQF